jgi:hypothetical protein
VAGLFRSTKLTCEKDTAELAKPTKQIPNGWEFAAQPVLFTAPR